MQNTANRVLPGVLLGALLCGSYATAGGREGIMLTGFHPKLTERPRLGARPGDREKMQEAIRTGGPLKKRYVELRDRLEPYIRQHETDPDHLMSRMLMHWGRHYTSFPAYTYTGHPRLAADAPFHKMRAPALAIRLEGEAWDRPFVAVYEGSARGKSSIQSVRRLADGTLTALEITGRSSRQWVLSAESPGQLHRIGNSRFQGTFGVIASDGASVELYLGQGAEISDGVHAIKSLDGAEFAASLRIANGKAALSTTARCRVTLDGREATVEPGSDHTW